jgi:hypothetical protein
MPKHRARVLVAAIAVMTAVPVSVIAAATSGPGTAVAAIGATGPTGATGTTGTTGTTPSKAPVVTTGGATQVSQRSAVLNGTVNPQGLSTTYYFQYGPTTTYGLQSSPANAGSGTGNVAVHSTITGLTPGTTYHYRLVAQNVGGTTYGADQSVVAGQGQSQVRFLGHEGFVSPGRVIGVEAGCFGGTSRCYGHVTMSHDGVVIGQRNFQIAPNSGGFQNLEISSRGEQMLMSYNHTFHLLPVTVKVTTSTGQTTTQVMHLARWLWH